MIVFHPMRICNVVSPIILLLYNWVEVDLKRLPVEHIWPEVMGIILGVNAWVVPFLKTFGVVKGNDIFHFSVSINIPHAIGELVREYFKIPSPDRRRFSTGTVYWDYK